MGMMSMDFKTGTEITIVADGADEEEAVKALAEHLSK
jgi:phosphotransferase system HPr-like phosphotransfer protein